MLRVLLTLALVATLSAASYAQEANDDCANAVEILIDIDVPYSTVGATSSGPAVMGCSGFTPPENDSIPADIWFTWTAQADGTYRWSNCGDGWDSRMAVYEGTDACAVTNDDLVNCNDDGAAALCPGSESQLDFLATAGTTYVLRLGGFANEETPITTGMGTVTLERLNVPDNDACQNAIAISLGSDQQFTTINATTDGPDHDPSNPCFQFGDPGASADVWYTFTPTVSGTIEWSTCDDATFDTRLVVYQPGSACPPMPSDLYECNDDGIDCPANSFRSQVFFDVVAGETYVLRLGGWNNQSGTGTFDLINNTPPPPPANDDCDNAIVTQIITAAEADDFAFAEVGTTIGATVADNFIAPPCANPDGIWADVWYKVASQGNDTIQIRIFPDGDTPVPNFYVEAFANCMQDTIMGDFNECLVIDDEENSGRTETITGLPVGGNDTILIRVSSQLTFFQPGTFGLQLVSEISTSTRPELAVEELKLFPNPATDRVTVSMNLPEATQLTARVHDLLGRNVLNRELGQLPGGTQQFDLDVAGLSPGVYSLQLTDGYAARSLKFVVN